MSSLRERIAQIIDGESGMPSDLALARADDVIAALPELQGWQPIETAPRDGKEIVIARADWDNFPVAVWMDYPGNPVLDANGNDTFMSGWGHDCIGFSEGQEDYWLGWDDDPTPTHWMPLPTPPVTKGGAA